MPANFWTRLINALWEFPCPLCGGDHAGPHDFNSFCPDCLATLPLLHGKRCPGCGGELSGAFEYCEKCLAMPPRPWSNARALMAMRDSGERVIYQLKFGHATVMARALGELAAPLLDTPDFRRADLIVPVPLHWFRRWQRGYNQAELLARAIAKRLRKPCQLPLRRIHATRRQATLRREERLQNLRHAFSVPRPSAVQGKIILLIDDVLTTGATLHAASRTLLEAGAREVLVFVAARR